MAPVHAGSRMAATARSPELAEGTFHGVRKSRLDHIDPQADQYESKPAAVPMVMLVARVTARMTASARVPSAEILPAAEALRGVAAAMDILRRAPAAKKMEAARVGWLAGRSRKALAHKGPGRSQPGIAALKACMLGMISYSRRPQSGQITCYLNRTYHVLPTAVPALA